jgi:hypothetical protein
LHILYFQQTAETFGLDEFPRTVTRSLAIETSTDSLVLISKQKISRSRLMELSSLPVVSLPTGYSSKNFKYRFLSGCQGTKYAVTAVHTEEEMQLFHGLTETKGKSDTKIFVPFNSAIPNFDKFAIVWNGEYSLHNRNVYYKSPQHLKAYYNIIEDRKKYGNTVLQNLAISEYVRAEVEDESRLQIIIRGFGIV